jgi:phospholipase/carboxylesterase
MHNKGRLAPGIVVGVIVLSVAALAANANGANGANEAAGASPAATAFPADPGATLRARIESARTRLLSHYRDVDARSGLADMLETRLDADESNLFAAGKPENVPANDFWNWNASIVTLDEGLVDQLTTANFHQAGSIRGTDEILVTEATGLPLQPCAIAVPHNYSPDKPAPLVVLLHGKGVSEASEISEPLFRGLASETGAIVIAPYGRGDDLRSAAGVQDVYAALDTVESALNVDRRHVYLAGDSLGGFAAFDVAPVRAGAWNALLTIRSTMDPADQQSVRDQLRGKAVYVVAGSADDMVRVDDVRRGVAWLRSVGLVTSYYESPGAGHDLIALGPLVQKAWRDMFSGVRSVQPPQLDIPLMTPAPSQKP